MNTVSYGISANGGHASGRNNIAIRDRGSGCVENRKVVKLVCVEFTVPLGRSLKSEVRERISSGRLW